MTCQALFSLYGMSNRFYKYGTYFLCMKCQINSIGMDPFFFFFFMKFQIDPATMDHEEAEIEKVDSVLFVSVYE